MAESFSREKLRQAPQKEGGEILYDPGWYVHKADIQNKWNDNSSTCFCCPCLMINVLVLSCPLHTNSGCGKERRILIGPW